MVLLCPRYFNFWGPFINSNSIFPNWSLNLSSCYLERSRLSSILCKWLALTFEMICISNHSNSTQVFLSCWTPWITQWRLKETSLAKGLKLLDCRRLEKTYLKTTKQEHANIWNEARRKCWTVHGNDLDVVEETATEITISNVMVKKHTHQF